MRIPTIIVSAFISSRVAQKAKLLGVDSIVAKPFRMDRIAGEIRRVLAGGEEEADDGEVAEDPAGM